MNIGLSDTEDDGLTLGSLFDGIAGFPLAAGRHGIKTVWTSVTLMGRAGGGGGRTGLYLLPYAQSGYAEFKEGRVGTIKKCGGGYGGGSETLVVTIERIAAVVKYRVRRLMPLECERLNGFPDGWTRYGASGKEISDNARYMALGNSIAVPCAERVFIGIIEAEKEERTGKSANEGTN